MADNRSTIEEKRDAGERLNRERIHPHSESVRCGDPAPAQRQAEPIQVSVCMPVYNGERTIKEAVRSALAQGENICLEVIVVDDGSTDGTRKVLEQFVADPRVRVLKNTEKKGAAGGRNCAVKAARGRYIAFLDADDLWEKGKLEAQLKAMEETGCVLSCTGRELLNPEGERTGRVISVPEHITYRSLLRSNWINCSSVVLLRSVALQFPMEHEDSHEDYITWLKILKTYGSAVGISRPLLLYRLTNGGKSGSKLKSARMTFKVYRYMGFGVPKSIACFISYALHGVFKYAIAGRRGKHER